MTSTAAADLALKDMSNDVVRAIYGADRFSVSVLSNRFRYIIDHVCAKLLTNAFSEIIRDYTDMSAALIGPPEQNFPAVAVANTLPMFFGSLADAVRGGLIEYGVEALRPGDLLMLSDPYRAGTHVNDVCFIRPIFHGGALIGAVTIRAHMLDWGGRVVGGFEATKANLYEDGLVCGPMLVYSAGKPVPATFNLVRDNTRFADIVLPDIRTIYHSLELGEHLLTEAVEKFGIEAYHGAARYTCDASAETMRAALLAIPDGVYNGDAHIDCDALHPDSGMAVLVRITKIGGRMELDFSGTSPAAPTAINCAWPDLKTAATVALKMAIEPRGPVTSGVMRDIDIVVPPDCVVNPSPPASCNFYWEPAMAASYAILKALNLALGERGFAPDGGPNMIHRANGIRADGRPWYASPGSRVTPWAPWGATREADGDSGQLSFISNLVDGGVEQSEVDTPMMIVRKEYVPDSGGAGYNRGGAASIADSYWFEAGDHRASTYKLKPGNGNSLGVYQGSNGSAGGCWLWDGDRSAVPARLYLPLRLRDSIYSDAIPLCGVLDPKTHEVDSGGSYHFSIEASAVGAGSVLRCLSNGAGGWGDAFARDPERVLRDVRDEYVTIEGAARDYGVVIFGDPQRDPEGLAIDRVATQALRAARSEVPA